MAVHIQNGEQTCDTSLRTALREAIETAEAKRQQAVEDLMWALINSAEFVFNH